MVIDWTKDKKMIEKIKRAEKNRNCACGGGGIGC